MSRLEGKVAVISGGNSGIGLAIAQRFVKEGAHVFIFARRREALDKAVQLIGADVTAIQADASKLEDLDRVADAIRSAKGKVDVVVSNAALSRFRLANQRIGFLWFAGCADSQGVWHGGKVSGYGER
jgi:NAD(P)-dependent dehydrogenase (short-subunit alcohol dehydrogenase family)